MLTDEEFLNDIANRQGETGHFLLVLRPAERDRLVTLAREALTLRAFPARARALVNALDHCKEVIDGAFVMAHIHGARYNGPSYGVELDALRQSLDALLTETD